MDITKDELNHIYQLGMQAGKEAVGQTKQDRYDLDRWENMRYENQSLVAFIHFVKMHYPEAIIEYEAVNKIKES